ncbi:MAG: C13 family peptidase, partial [Candidatus Parabeggiatoa sp.]|nr:C13 family peptidase [Candidatus Parabeggiatoa sp.]
GTSLGTAILIAGIARPKDTLFTYSNEYVQRMYSLLKERGFTDEDIHYMNPQPPDLDGDGYLETELQDYQLIDPAEELEDAFEKAASHLQPGQQFVFYWHGHALPDYFRLKQDYELSAEQLNQLFEKIPTGVKQVIMLDSCYSGSFIDELKGVANRIVITSADASNKAWEIQYDSFSNKLIRELRRGETVGNAFFSAREMVTSQPQWFGNQDPWLDDDGDGSYTVSGDGRYAARTYLGRKGLHAAHPPEIVQVHPSVSLTGETANATLWVKVIPNRAEAINQVRAVLIRPNWQLDEYQGETTHFERTELALRYNSAQERYETGYDYFCTAGQWRILYQVQSKEGIWSDVQFGEIQQTPDIQASTCLTPMTVKMGLNQTRYTTGNTLLLDMTVNGAGDADLYVAIIFPDGNFMTLGYPDEFGFPNTPDAYIAASNIAGEKTYPLFNFPIPEGLALGNYSTCGVLVPPNTDDVLDQSKWIHVDCPGFEMY